MWRCTPHIVPTSDPWWKPYCNAIIQQRVVQLNDRKELTIDADVGLEQDHGRSVGYGEQCSLVW